MRSPPAAGELPTSDLFPDHLGIDAIRPLLLYELRAMQLYPDALQIRLRGWGHDLVVAEIVEALRQLCDEGLVDGPGISLLHHQQVWLTGSGEARAHNLGSDLGGWRQVASASTDNVCPAL
jgi:hypothetical protein